MQIKIESRHPEDVMVVIPDIFQDSRGFFSETYRADQFRALGLPTEFVQDNHSRSARGVVRGLHFQWEPPMGKLMRVTAGSAFLVARYAGMILRSGSGGRFGFPIGSRYPTGISHSGTLGGSGGFG